MADDKRPRARDVAIDAGRRQRQIAGTSEAARRQMLATTLRLAGHTVSQNREVGQTARTDGAAQSSDAAETDADAQSEETTLSHEAARSGDVAGATDEIRIQVEEETEKHTTIDSADRVDARSERQQRDNASAPDEMTESDDSLQIDDSALDDDAASADDPAAADTASESGESETSDDLQFVDDPASLTDPDLELSADEPTLSIDPADQSVAFAFEPRPATSPSVAAVSAAESAVGSTSVADPPMDDTPPDFPMVLEGDSASLHRQPAPGTQSNHPSPGAGSLSISPSVETDAGSEDGDEGDRASISETAKDKPGSNATTKRAASQRSIDVTPVHGDQIQTEVVQKVMALIDAKVAQRIDQLRHEMFVSRAAWSSVFPR